MASGRAALTLIPSEQTVALHADMLDRIAVIEKAITELQRPPRGIGDNNPPLSADEIREVREALATLKAQPALPQTLPQHRETVAAVGMLKKLADTFLTEAAREAAKRAVQSPFWLTVIHQLPALTDVAHQWLASFGAHL